jgi:hypothetical protein
MIVFITLEYLNLLFVVEISTTNILKQPQIPVYKGEEEEENGRKRKNRNGELAPRRKNRIR